MSMDFIGDIHGHVERLEALLKALGYAHTRGAWRHPSRKVMFLGDFIDRGPGQIATLTLVRAMIEAGSARAVMGNHEFNAIAWATSDPDEPGHYLRPRHGDRGQNNRHQHSAFLSELVEDGPEHRAWIAFFMDLPLWIEGDDFQVVHACWSAHHMAGLAPLLNADRQLTTSGLMSCARYGTPAFEALEVILKGPEVQLPNGHRFFDTDGHPRTAIRTRWWDAKAHTYAAAYIGPPAAIPDLPLPQSATFPMPAKPTFIGHYWFTPGKRMELAAPLVACVDYSVAKNGVLAAYRFDGKAELSAQKFVTV
jgi:Calcineurin-like phosphoesterase